jgi:hypothetical protein
VSSLLRVVDKEKAHPGTEGFSGKVNCTAMSGVWDQSEHWRAIWGSTGTILELLRSILAERWLRRTWLRAIGAEQQRRKASRGTIGHAAAFWHSACYI